jgi:DNA repair protein RadC
MTIAHCRHIPAPSSMSIRDWPVNERPREKLLANGAQSLSDAELLAVLLGGSGRAGLDAVAMARELLRRHESLRGLLSAPRNPRPATLGLGVAGYCRLQAAVELARRHYAGRRSTRRRRREIS